MTESTTAPKEKLQVKLLFKYEPLMFILDLFIRIVSFVMYIQDIIPTWLFITFQITLAIVEVFIHEEYKAKVIKKYKPFINPEYSKNGVEIVLDDNVPESMTGVQIIGGFCFSFWLMYHISDNHSWYMFLVFFGGAALGAFVLILPLFATTKFKQSQGPVSVKVSHKVPEVLDPKKEPVIKYIDVTKQYPNILQLQTAPGAKDEVVTLDAVDYNDTQIASLESELKSINHKVDAYLMESVFLGGLAFSGFLTVAAANFLGRETEVFRQFIDHLTKFASTCSDEGMTAWFTEIPKYFLRNDLYILIMLLCLLASVFFLLVLTLRLRLNSLSLNMDHLIRILTIFNAKEEELYNAQYEGSLNDASSNRLKNIGKKIDHTLADANKLLKELKPTVAVMSIYRNVAVFLFFLVLIVSGFYFMPMMATLIFALAVFTQLFRILETYSKIGKIRALLKKH
jgi:hypothetical protein